MDSEHQGSFHHATNPSGGWKYEMRGARLEQSITLVTVVRVGELAGGDNAAALQIIRGVPADGTPSQRTEATSSCNTWLKDVLVALDEARVVQLPMPIGKPSPPSIAACLSA